MADRFEVTDESRADWHRNIVSLRRSIDIFADLVDNPADTAILMEHEMGTKPARQPQPLLSRPFETAQIYDPIAAAIEWPFEHPAVSRFSAGAYGVWYGARTLEASIHETAYHFRRNTLASEIARNSAKPIVQERRVHLVHCGASLVDLRALCARDERLMDPGEYAHCQALGAELRASFLPGLITRSARVAGADVVGVFVREALSDPRDVCFLTYALDVPSQRVHVERARGKPGWTIDP